MIFRCLWRECRFLHFEAILKLAYSASSLPNVRRPSCAKARLLIVHSVYSFDDTSGDTSLSSFSISNAPSYLFSVILDIMTVNSQVKVHVVPWSPPGWMKSGGTMGWCRLKFQHYIWLMISIQMVVHWRPVLLAHVSWCFLHYHEYHPDHSQMPTTFWNVCKASRAKVSPYTRYPFRLAHTKLYSEFYQLINAATT